MPRCITWLREHNATHSAGHYLALVYLCNLFFSPLSSHLITCVFLMTSKVLTSSMFKPLRFYSIMPEPLLLPIVPPIPWPLIFSGLRQHTSQAGILIAPLSQTSTLFSVNYVCIQQAAAIYHCFFYSHVHSPTWTINSTRAGIVLQMSFYY